MDAVIGLLNDWQPPPVGAAAKARLIAAALRAAGVRRPPPPPKAELHLRGRKHTSERDREAVRHHYDVGNEFFALFLDESMTYSCAIFSRGAKTLEEAQETKLDLVCTKLALQEGERVLDVGCGWGSFVMHAASRYGVEAVGITLSEPQAELARQAGRRRRARRPRSRSGSRTTASSPARASTRSPRSAWSSTSASRRSTPTPSSSPRC